MEYICEYCNFNTKKKYNYDKHIESNKHKILESKLVVTPKSTQSQHLVIPESTQNQQKVAAPFTCKYCEQNFKFKQSMYRHIKYTCTKNKTEDLTELVRLLNARLEKQDKQLETQAKQIDKLMGKLEINGSFNNTVNITNNINLLNYKDTDTSHLTDEDYKKCLRKASRCVLKLIEKVHFNPEKPENMNVYISNMKDKYMMMYQDNKWTLTNKDELNTVYNHKEDLIEEWFNINKDPEMEKFFNRYVELKDDKITMETVQEEYKLLMFNNRDLIKN
jgi:protein-arginine kinase activator protein McsA